jgi:hypothetical protein
MRCKKLVVSSSLEKSPFFNPAASSAIVLLCMLLLFNIFWNALRLFSLSLWEGIGGGDLFYHPTLTLPLKEEGALFFIR